MSESAAEQGESVVLFDGECNLCDGSVQFILKRDRRKQFRFAPLQSAAAVRLAPEDAVTGDDAPKSIILVENGKIYRESSAALRIARQLDGLWSLLAVFLIVPPFIRNIVYRWIARNRYRWFGKKESCLFPTGELRERFLTE